ncbi:MAG TPA: hypothetical protein VFA74_10075 [Terriglobales bacterium]|nr:hypothetical protein [Terriglobales bacterium]
MKRAAFGIQVHSGWGVLVAVSGDPASVEVLERKRIIIADPTILGAKQPYHSAMGLAPAESEKHIANCAAVSKRMAFTVIGEAARNWDERGYKIIGAAVLWASGRPLPSLAKILAAHPLIHTAEGEFFRNAVREACEDLKIPVTAIRERELDDRAKTELRMSEQVQHRIATLGKFLGPPWTKDHKTAALAATVVLAG